MKLKPLDDAALKELQSQPIVAKLGTTSKSGDVRITPIWFRAESDGSILLNTFADSAPVRNLRRNPKCSLLIDSRDWPYYAIHYWGTATIEGPEDDAAGIAAMFTPYVGTLEGATDYAKTLISYGKRVYIRFRPVRNVSYDFRQ
jgi:Pyridoxamine 5'-phosphate oxidase